MKEKVIENKLVFLNMKDIESTKKIFFNYMYSAFF